MTAPTPPRPPLRRWIPAQRQRETMVRDIGGLPLITLRLNAVGELEPGYESMLVADLDAAGATDLLVFCHGANSAVDGPSPLGQAFFRNVPPLLKHHGQPGRRVALLAIEWPGRRWSDELIPGVDAADRPPASGALGGWPAPAPPDVTNWRATRSAFDPVRRAEVDELLGLLLARPNDSTALKRARTLIRILAEVAPDDGDGERLGVTSVMEIDDPHPDQLFADFALRLSELGVVTDLAGGRAGFGDSVARLWHGAHEATRQLTYWQLKGRARVIGEDGLGPLMARLHAKRPKLGINLIGHGLGARVAAYALRGLPDGKALRSVTLLQGALSHFAFADKLPFDSSRSGLLSGLQNRVTGPVVACYSRFDTAVGDFYSLAGRTVGPDASGCVVDRLEPVGYREGGLGHDGHQPAARAFALNPPGFGYDFVRPGLVSIDASRVVRQGRPPSGAHSDICHPELAWVALTAGGIC